MLAERKLRRRVRRCLVALLVVGAMAAGGSPAFAPGDDMIPDLQALLFAPVSPNELPARKSVPIRLSLWERVKYQASPAGVAPSLRQLDVDFDRHLRLSVEGLPRCPRPFGDYGPRSDTLVKCEDAKVGSGTLKVKVHFPEQQPVGSTGRVSVYNGGSSDGRTMFWLYAYIPAPVTGAILMPLDVRRSIHGIYGWTGTLSVPQIANGSGAITELEIRIRRGIFSASCPTGKLQTGGASRFSDGQVLSSASIQTC